MKKTNFKKIRKKGLLLLVLLMTLTFSFANAFDGVNKRAVEAFQKQFARAQNINWNVRREYTRVSFVLDSSCMNAYYGSDGELLAITRNIVSSQLPLVQALSLQERYKDYQVKEMVELRLDEETSYYVSLENAKSKLILKSNGDNWNVYSRENKFHR